MTALCHSLRRCLEYVIGFRLGSSFWCALCAAVSTFATDVGQEWFTFRRSFMKSEKKALCGDHAFPSVRPSMAKHQRRTLWRIFMKFGQPSMLIVKTGPLTVILHLAPYVNFCSYFPYFLTDLVEIRYSTPVWCCRVIYWRTVNFTSIDIMKSIFTCLYKLVSVRHFLI